MKYRQATSFRTGIVNEVAPNNLQKTQYYFLKSIVFQHHLVQLLLLQASHRWSSTTQMIWKLRLSLVGLKFLQDQLLVEWERPQSSLVFTVDHKPLCQDQGRLRAQSNVNLIQLKAILDLEKHQKIYVIVLPIHKIGTNHHIFPAVHHTTQQQLQAATRCL